MGDTVDTVEVSGDPSCMGTHGYVFPEQSEAIIRKITNQVKK
jgi:hypothetical protein